MMKHLRQVAAGLFAALIAQACQNAPVDTAGAAISPGWMGNVYLASGPARESASKVLVLVYLVNSRDVTLTDANVFYGSASRLPVSGKDFLIEILDADARTLATYAADDPRKMIVERQGNVLASEGVLTARLPFDPAVATAQVRNGAGNVVERSELRKIVQAFCAGKTSDPDCEAALRGRP